MLFSLNFLSSIKVFSKACSLPMIDLPTIRKGPILDPSKAAQLVAPVIKKEVDDAIKHIDSSTTYID